MMFSMLKYIAPPDFALEIAKNKLHSMIIVGSMASGKTTWTLSLIARAIEELLSNGKDDSEIAVVHALEMSMTRTVEEVRKSLDLDRVRYLYWFSDDAPAAKGMHGRRAMSSENVAESQFYTVIRHRLEKRGFNGFIFVAHATQVYNLIDVTFRRLAKIKAFKDYPDEPSDLKIIGPMLGKTYMRKLADITYKIWSPQSREELIEGLSSAVVRFIKRKKVVKVEKRELPKSVAYLRIEREEDENEETGNATEKRVEVELFEKGLKAVKRGNKVYIYRKVDGKHVPLATVKF